MTTWTQITPRHRPTVGRRVRVRNTVCEWETVWSEGLVSPLAIYPVTHFAPPRDKLPPDPNRIEQQVLHAVQAGTYAAQAVADAVGIPLRHVYTYLTTLRRTGQVVAVGSRKQREYRPA